MISCIVVWDLIVILTEIFLYVNTGYLSIVDIKIIEVYPLIVLVNIPHVSSLILRVIFKP
jgi:hypothetical protein